MNWCTSCNRRINLCVCPRPKTLVEHVMAFCEEEGEELPAPPELCPSCGADITNMQTDHRMRGCRPAMLSPFEDRVVGGRWYWIKIMWGADHTIVHTVPGTATRGSERWPDHWETIHGKAWPSSSNAGASCWVVVGLVFPISDPPELER